MELATRAARNSIFSLISFLYPTVLTIVVTPIFIHYLGPTRYGIYALSQVVFSFISLLDFGVAPTLLKFVSEHAARGEIKELNATVAATLVFYAAIGILGVLIASVIAVFFVGDLFRLSGELRSTTQFVLVVAGFSFLFSMLVSGLSSIPAGLQRFDLVTVLGIALQTPAVLANVLVLYLGFGLRGLAIVGFIATAVGIPVFALVDRKLIPGFRPIPRWEPQLLREVFSFSAYAFIANFTGAILFQLDKIFIGALSGVKSVTYYTIPGSLAQRIHSASASLSVVVLPLASDLFARGEDERVQQLYRRAIRFVTLFVVTVGVPLFVFARDILHYWLNSGFAENSTDVLRLLLITYSLLALTTVAYYVVMGAGKPWLAAVYGTVAAVLNVILIVILIPPYGIVGAAVAYLVSSLAALPFVWYTERKVLGIVKGGWLRNVATLALPAAIQAGACVALLPVITNFVSLVAALLITLPVPGVLFYALGFADADDRALLARLIPRRG